MNVMIAAQYTAPKSGNFIPCLLVLGRAIIRRGDNVVYVFPEEREWTNWIREEGFDVVIAGQKSLQAKNQIKVLKPLLDKYKINLLHLHFGMFHHAVTHNRKAIRNTKVIIHDHMGFSVQPSVWKQYVFLIAHSLDYSLKDINLIAVQKKKKESYLFLRNKWYVPNGLSMERHIEHSMTREECRETFDVSPTDKVCLLLGWDMKRKGVDVALKAIQKCRDKDSNVVLGVIGLGQGAPTERTREFMKAETPDIDPGEAWIKFLNSYEDIFAVYRAADVYLMASRNEGLPYSLLEAISQNTPTVISDIQENQFARQYSNGYYYPVEDVDACADAIMRALQRGRIETNSSRLIEEYSVDKWCEAVLKVYDIANKKK